MIVWKQGPFYPELGKKIVEFPYKISIGPSDDLIRIDGFKVQPDMDGNFTKGTAEREYSEDEFDAIHVFATARMVLDLFEEILGEKIYWSWWDTEKLPLKFKIRNNDINARYLKDQKCIELDFYGPYKNWTYNCRTVDLIAHETGHAILDMFKPEWKNGNAETRGLEEAFCDLAAMFLILYQEDLCSYVIKESKGDLSEDSILSLFAVGHGFNKSKNNAIRSAINDIEYDQDDWNSYNYAQILVAVLYEVLIDEFQNKRNSVKDKSKLLHQIGNSWMKEIIYTFLKCDSEKSSIYEFAKIYSCEAIEYGLKIKKHLINKKVLK